MTHISEQTLEEIRQRADIVDIIGSRLQLKRAGVNYKACCPFHREKTPSFVVSPPHGTFHCFGCGAHGDVFKYLMLADGMTFVDAVRSLAKQTGVTIDETVDYEAAARGVLFRLHTELAAFFSRCLEKIAEAEPARQYLKARKLDADTVKKFGIGYAPSGAAVLETWASKHGFHIEKLVEAGILLPPHDGRDSFYNRFRGRLMFPIRDTTGQVIGFSGRLLDANAKAAKYVNSPETPIFHKSNVLYALDFARNAIVHDSRREALVCEGQIDVIRCHANGFSTAVASQGTAFTEEHVKLLKRYADCAMLLFDGDGAGMKAAVHTGRLFLQAGIPVRIATLPVGEDPDSLLRDKGPDALKKILDAPESIVEFQIRSLRSKETSPNELDAVARTTAQIIETLADCSKAVMRSVLLQEAAERLKVPPEALETDLESYLAKKTGKKKNNGGDTAEIGPSTSPVPRVVPPKPRVAAKRTDSALTCIAEMLIHFDECGDDVFEAVRDWLPPEVMGDTPEAEIINAALSDHASGKESLAMLSENGAAPVRNIISRLACMAGRILPSAGLTQLDAVRDLICRAWVDYMNRVRAGLDLTNSDECALRFSLTRSIKQIEATNDWAERANAIYPEYKRICEKTEAPEHNP